MTTNLYDTIGPARNKHDKSTLHNLKCSIYFLTPELSLVNNNPTAPSSNLKVQLWGWWLNQNQQRLRKNGSHSQIVLCNNNHRLVSEYCIQLYNKDVRILLMLVDVCTAVKDGFNELAAAAADVVRV